MDAAVLAAGKGWVLAMLPVLPAKRRVRVAPVPAPRAAALALRCVPRRREGVGTKGVPPQQRPKRPCRAGRQTKG